MPRWSQPLYGVQCLVDEQKLSWASVADYGQCATATMYTPGNMARPHCEQHHTVSDAQAAAEKWLAEQRS